MAYVAQAQLPSPRLPKSSPCRVFKVGMIEHAMNALFNQIEYFNYHNHSVPLNLLPFEPALLRLFSPHSRGRRLRRARVGLDSIDRHIDWRCKCFFLLYASIPNTTNAF